MFHSLGSMVCLRLSCCTHTCFPTAAHCFVGGSGVRIFDDELSDYGQHTYRSEGVVSQTRRSVVSAPEEGDSVERVGAVL